MPYPQWKLCQWTSYSRKPVNLFLSRPRNYKNRPKRAAKRNKTLQLSANALQLGKRRPTLMSENKNIITVDVEEVALLVNQGKDIVFTPEAEKALIALL